MELTCYRLTAAPVEIAPGRPDRDWMDAFAAGHAYRCLPLTIANTTGWELIAPSSFTATWNGGAKQGDIEITSPFNGPPNAHAHWAMSHFGAGVLTFVTGYLFRTPAGWDTWVGGPPNLIKHGIQPLTGVVETSWLAHPFTMNWRFTAPGSVSFHAGEPFGLIMPVPHAAIDGFEPIVRELADDPELAAYARQSAIERETLIADQLANPGARQWQRQYFKGEHPGGQRGAGDHISKRRLKPPRPAGEGD